jgi:membrane protein
MSDQVDAPNPARLLRRFRSVLAVAVGRWMAPRTSLFAAALAFHALLALAPMLMVLLSAAGRLLGQESAQRSLSEAAVRFAGPGADQMVTALLGLLTATRWQSAGTVLGVVLLLFFASSFFATLRAAFDAVWEVRPKGLGHSLLGRAVSSGQTLLAIAAALLVLAAGSLRLVVAPVLARAGMAGAIAWIAWTRLTTLLMIAVALGAVFRYVPSVKPRPRRGAILAGALPAALLLNLASEVFGLVIAKSAVASLYGAAASVIMFLLWVQYAAWIVLLGAEVCRAWGDPALTAHT